MSGTRRWRGRRRRRRRKETKMEGRSSVTLSLPPPCNISRSAFRQFELKKSFQSHRTRPATSQKIYKKVAAFTSSPSSSQPDDGHFHSWQRCEKQKSFRPRIGMDAREKEKERVQRTWEGNLSNEIMFISLPHSITNAGK